MLDPSSIFGIINTGGVVGLLVVILLGGVKKWWVFGWQYREQAERYNQLEHSNIKWMELALRSTNLVESISEVNKSSPRDLR